LPGATTKQYEILSIAHEALKAEHTDVRNRLTILEEENNKYKNEIEMLHLKAKVGDMANNNSPREGEDQNSGVELTQKLRALQGMTNT
jgi:hypothetical protein